MNKFVVPLIQMICSLLTLALWFQWRFNQGKWIQQTLRPCQRARAEEGTNRFHLGNVCPLAGLSVTVIYVI